MIAVVKILRRMAAMVKLEASKPPEGEIWYI